MGEPMTQPGIAHPDIVSTNPATGEELGRVPVMGPEVVRFAVERAREAQTRWARRSPKERGQAILQVRDLIVAEVEDLCERISRENGKTLLEALSMEVMIVADLATYFAKRAHRILAPRDLPLHLLKHRRSVLHYEPRGVVGVIAPWNFPFAIPIGEVIMALLAGNAVVLKPSEQTPLIALHARELFVRAGIDPDLFQVVTGFGQTGAALVDSGVDMVVFTGSVATGRRVAAACGERLIPCTMELGGKAPAIVCEDADLERAANALVWGAFGNSGQICASVERAYVHERVYEAFVALVERNVRLLRQGDPLSHDTDVGAICFPRQLEVAETLIGDAVERGARVLVGGKRRQGPGTFFEPTVLVDVDQGMRVMREETFGPVLPIMKVAGEREALMHANDSHLGLLAYVFSLDRERAQRIAGGVRAGTVMINDVLTTYGMPETPWHGVKQSGLGRVHSAEGLRDLCEVRHVNSDRVRPLGREIWWYPYSERTWRFGIRAVRFLFGGWLRKRG